MSEIKKIFLTSGIRYPASILFLISLLNILPLLLFDIGGDIDFHLALIKCFAGQFWQGDLYPRWCLAANNGFGSPAPLFYFPLPYYAAAILYPLTHLGIPLYGIYVLSLFVATVLTGLTCWLWLKDIVSPKRALLAAVLFLFLPYRMEAMLFRSAYAEIWAIAWLPLVFMYVRRLALGKPAMLPLAAVFGLLFLTHIPAAAAAVLASGVYMLVMSRAWLPKWRYAASLLWGMALAAFYIAPAAYYKQFMFKAPVFIRGHLRGWPNTYLSLDNLLTGGQMRLSVAIGLTVLSLIILSLVMLRGRFRIEDAFVRREVVAWSLLFALALFLLFPVSAPFYALLGPLSQVVFPWRMQTIFMLSLIFFLAVWMQWFISERRLKTWKADYALLLALLVLMAYFVVSVREESTEDASKTIIEDSLMLQPEYRSVWIDEAHFTADYIAARYDPKERIASADIISGKGKITVERWKQDGIALRAESAHGMTVRLHQFYFPVWSAQAGDGEPVSLHPEAATGQMLLDIPAGRHRVTLHYAVAVSPWLWLADGASALAALTWLYLILTGRKTRVTRTS